MEDPAGDPGGPASWPATAPAATGAGAGAGTSVVAGHTTLEAAPDAVPGRSGGFRCPGGLILGRRGFERRLGQVGRLRFFELFGGVLKRDFGRGGLVQ